MFNNIFSETQLIEQYYGEYLQSITRYANIYRQSIFCRYLNINLSGSSRVIDNQSTYDKYNSGIMYDVYEYTPLFYVAQLINDVSDQSDLIGQMFQGTTNVIIYSIREPHIDDVIMFPYPPLNGNELFRVTNIRVAINGKTSTEHINWYELTLEYAPIMNIMNLNFINQYIYSLASQRYLIASAFINMMNYLKQLELKFDTLSSYFNNTLELYYIILNGKKVAPIVPNRIIYDFLTDRHNYNHLFISTNRPFGINRYLDIVDPDICLDIETGKLITNVGNDMVFETDQLLKLIKSPIIKSQIINLLQHDGYVFETAAATIQWSQYELLEFPNINTYGIDIDKQKLLTITDINTFDIPSL